MTRNRSKVDRRHQVWAKTNGLCAHCGRQASSILQTVDHYVPKSWDSGYDLRNLMPLCKKCNVARGNAPIAPYTFYKYAPKEVIDLCVQYENEFKRKYRTLGDAENNL